MTPPFSISTSYFCLEHVVWMPSVRSPIITRSALAHQISQVNVTAKKPELSYKEVFFIILYFFIGNPAVECVRIPSTCYANTDCPETMACTEGICMPSCQGWTTILNFNFLVYFNFFYYNTEKMQGFFWNFSLIVVFG